MARGRNRTFMNEEIIEVMKRYACPFMTLTEIADELGKSKGAVHPRLKELHENGEIQRKKVGGRAVIWWLPERYQSAEVA